MILDIESKCCLSFINNIEGALPNTLRLGEIRGDHFWGYLHFDLSSLPTHISLVSAQLVLGREISWRESMSQAFWETKYFLAPSKEFMSLYSQCMPPIEQNYMLPFRIEERKAIIEIDFLRIVSAWLNGTVSNKGLILFGTVRSQGISFITKRCRAEGFIPFIRIEYRELDPLPPISPLPIVELPMQFKIGSDE